MYVIAILAPLALADPSSSPEEPESPSPSTEVDRAPCWATPMTGCAAWLVASIGIDTRVPITARHQGIAGGVGVFLHRDQDHSYELSAVVDWHNSHNLWDPSDPYFISLPYQTWQLGARAHHHGPGDGYFGLGVGHVALRHAPRPIAWAGDRRRHAGPYAALHVGRPVPTWAEPHGAVNLKVVWTVSMYLLSGSVIRSTNYVNWSRGDDPELIIDEPADRARVHLSSTLGVQLGVW